MAVVVVLAGCTPPPVPGKQRYFWPIGAPDPKLEFIGVYQSDYDIKLGGESALVSAVFGKEPPISVFKMPNQVASDSRGKIFVCDGGLHRVVILDLPNHKISYLKDLRGQDLFISFPGGIAIGGKGEVWVSDSANHKLLLFGSDGRLKREIGEKDLARPTGLTFDPARGRLYSVDTDRHRLVVFDSDGEVRATLGRRGHGPGEFNFPIDADVDADGNLYVLDALNARVQVFDPELGFLREFGERGTASGSFQMPKGIAVSPEGWVCVTDSLASRFVIFDTEGKYLLTVGGREPVVNGAIVPGGFYFPAGIDIDGNSAVLIADSLNAMVQHYQFLTPAYLRDHPILPGETFIPPSFRGHIQKDRGGIEDRLPAGPSPH